MLLIRLEIEDGSPLVFLEEEATKAHSAKQIEIPTFSGDKKFCNQNFTSDSLEIDCNSHNLSAKDLTSGTAAGQLINCQSVNENRFTKDADNDGFTSSATDSLFHSHNFQNMVNKSNNDESIGARRDEKNISPISSSLPSTQTEGSVNNSNGWELYRGRRKVRQLTVESYDMSVDVDITLPTNNLDKSKSETAVGSASVPTYAGVVESKSTDSVVSDETGLHSLGSLAHNSTKIIPFYSGNPYVEKTSGILHLYKRNSASVPAGDILGGNGNKIADAALDKMTVDEASSVAIAEKKTWNIDGTEDNSETCESSPSPQKSQIICILAMSASVSCQDLLQFLAPVRESVLQMRVIRDSTPNQYMVLLYFRSVAAADEFYANYDRVQLNSFDPELCCHLAYVDRVETLRSSEGAGFPVEHHTELPTCPVCLERMDESVEGILTILCNHTFHGGCMAQWTDSTSCPVCRYPQTPEMEEDHICEVCGRQEDLWICLICGSVGCGRYEQAHAFQHFADTSHTYSLQVGGQRVWDYAGDNYVHRLIQSKTDGKLVEVTQHQEPMDIIAGLRGEEKMDSLTLECTHLLTSQLESQRLFFEDKMDQMEKATLAQLDQFEARSKESLTQVEKLQDRLATLEADKTATEKKMRVLVAKNVKLAQELTEEKAINQTLLADQQKWSSQFTKVEKELDTVKSLKNQEISDLSEQLRDLMFHMEAESKLRERVAEKPDEGAEIEGAHVAIGESAPPVARKRKSRKK